MKTKLSKLIKQLNRKNAPPDGWKPEDKVQAPSAKQLPQLKDIRYYVNKKS